MRHTSARADRPREAGTTPGIVHSHAFPIHNQILSLSIDNPVMISIYENGNKREVLSLVDDLIL
jgi:hypothetical protein